MTTGQCAEGAGAEEAEGKRGPITMSMSWDFDIF